MTHCTLIYIPFSLFQPLTLLEDISYLFHYFPFLEQKSLGQVLSVMAPNTQNKVQPSYLASGWLKCLSASPSSRRLLGEDAERLTNLSFLLVQQYAVSISCGFTWIPGNFFFKGNIFSSSCALMGKSHLHLVWSFHKLNSCQSPLDGLKVLFSPAHAIWTTCGWFPKACSPFIICATGVSER